VISEKKYLMLSNMFTGLKIEYIYQCMEYLTNLKIMQHLRKILAMEWRSTQRRSIGSRKKIFTMRCHNNQGNLGIAMAQLVLQMVELMK